MNTEISLPDDPSKATVRRCSRPTQTEDGKGVCGWMVFDEVVILVDATESNIGPATAEIRALACRSCGALQPNGIPAVVADQLSELEICKPDVQ